MSSRQEKKQRRAQREHEVRQVHEFLFETVGKLRKVLGPELRRQRDTFPNHMLPCFDCAFRSATDGSEGQERTFLGLLATLVSGETFNCHIDPLTCKPFPTNEAGDYGVAEAVGAGQPVNPCVGWLTLQAWPPDYYIGLIADVIAKRPVPRPIPEPLRSQIATDLPKLWNTMEAALRE